MNNTVSLPAAMVSTNNEVSQRRMDIEQLDVEIQRLVFCIDSASYELLVRVREFDERAGWLQWGCTSCAQWLAWRGDFGLSAAREKVRMAHALKGLKKISAAFAGGKLSYSKVRALTRVASIDSEAELLQFALRTTATRVEERCRQIRNVLPGSTAESNRAHGARSVRCFRDRQRHVMTITLELPIEEGELYMNALDKVMEQQSQAGSGTSVSVSAAMAKASDSDTSFTQSQAEAAVEMAKRVLSSDGGTGHAGTAEQYQVVVHVDAEALSANVSDDDCCHSGNHVMNTDNVDPQTTIRKARADLPIETVKRLSCDGSIIKMMDGPDGEPLSVGRKQRTVSTAIKRALWSRDRCCRYPGCHNTRFVDAHHVRHWSAGGETSVDNLILLCSRHHRLVHEAGFRIDKDHLGSWYFIRPDGRGVPEMGYCAADMVDECSEDFDDNPSAGGSGSGDDDQTDYWRVSDIVGVYGLCHKQNSPEPCQVKPHLHHEQHWVV